MVASAMLSLRQNQEINFHIHAFNHEYSEVSASIADDFDVLSFGADPNYVPQIVELVKNNGLQVLMPWSDEEALALSSAKEELAKAGCHVLVSPPDVTQTITDKSKTYDMIKTAGLSVPDFTVVSKPADIYHAVKFYGYPSALLLLNQLLAEAGEGCMCYWVMTVRQIGLGVDGVKIACRLSIRMIWNMDQASILSCRACMHRFMMLMCFGSTTLPPNVLFVKEITRPGYPIPEIF